MAVKFMVPESLFFIAGGCLGCSPKKTACDIRWHQAGIRGPLGRVDTISSLGYQKNDDNIGDNHLYMVNIWLMYG